MLYDFTPDRVNWGLEELMEEHFSCGTPPLLQPHPRERTTKLFLVLAPSWPAAILGTSLHFLAPTIQRDSVVSLQPGRVFGVAV